MSSLSFNKLKNLLDEHNLTIDEYYTDSEYNCIYLKVIHNYTEFIMYIPSKYKIKVETEEKNMYKITEIEEEKEEEIKSPSLEKIQLDETKKMSLENITIKNEKRKKIEKYLEKILVCVENIPYKIGIVYKRELYVITRGNEVMVYKIERENKNVDKNKKLYIISDLENLVERNNMMKEIKNVKKNLIDMFNKNYEEHIKSIDKLIKFKTLDYYKIQKTIIQYDKYLNRLEIVYEESKKKREILKKRLNIYKSVGKHDDQNLINISEKRELEVELEKLDEIIKKGRHYYQEIISEKDNIIINVNRVFFENEEMLIGLHNNYKKIEKMIE
jgi:hypothetical protein